MNKGKMKLPLPLMIQRRERVMILNEKEKVDTEDVPKMKKKLDTDAKEETTRNSVSQEMSSPTRTGEVSIKFSISDVKDMYKDAVLRPKWKAFQTVIFLEKDDGLQDSSKIAAFDFDGCLANTSVKRMAQMHGLSCILQYQTNCKVIFTNESNIDRWIKKRQVAVDSKIGRLANFINRVKVPMQVFIACGLGKPRDGDIASPNQGCGILWNSTSTRAFLLTWISHLYFLLHYLIKIFMFCCLYFECHKHSHCWSFYVGDAAGREKDHSDADIKFAQAVGLKFYVPEEYFNP